MPINLTAYETMAARGFADIKQIQSIAHAAIVKSNFPDNNADFGGMDLGRATNPAIGLLTNLTDEELSIPPLVFPLLVDTSQASTRRSKSYILVDVRPYLSGNVLGAGKTLNIRNRDKFDFFVTLGLLTNMWVHENRRNSFRYMGSAPMAVYASLVSKSISQQYALDLGEELKIAIVAAAFYSRLFDEGSTIGDGEKVGVVKQVAAATRAPVEMIYEVLDQVKSLGNVGEMVETVRDVLQNPRLDKLSLGTFVTIINSKWYGPYGRELILAAMEHPPTWVSILYAAYTDRSMNKSGVATVADRFKGSRGGDDFVRQMKVLVTNSKSEG